MKRQNTGVDTEEGHATNYFNTSIFEVECIVGRDGFRLNGRFAIEAICCGEVGQAGDTGRWRCRN